MSGNVDRSKIVTNLLNGTLFSLKNVVPMEHEYMKPQLVKNHVTSSFGVLVGITGDVQAKLAFTGNPTAFSLIGKKMYGMPLEGEMLLSFTGELGNMIAGGLSSNVAKDGIDIDITTPILMKNHTTVTDFSQALTVPISFKKMDEMNIHLLLD